MKLNYKLKKHLNITALRQSFSKIIRQVPDWRDQKKVNYSLHDIVMAAFSCMYFQCPSFLDYQKNLEKRLTTSNFHKMFDAKGIPKEGQIRNVLDQIDPKHFQAIFKHTFRHLQRSKILQHFQYNDFLPCAVDGSTYFSSKNIHCNSCLKKEHRGGDLSYSHQVLLAAAIHPDQKQAIPFFPEE